MYLQHFGASRHTAFQFHDGIGTPRIDRDAGDHPAGEAGYHLKQIIIGYIEMGFPPVGLAVAIIDCILGKDHALAEARLLKMIGQR